MTDKPYYELRIIGGTLKGRRMMFPVLEGVKISRDAVRETLFNGLSYLIAEGRSQPFEGMQVLDGFSGSGILGFEALSRGASTVTFIEKKLLAAQAIATAAHRWGVFDKINIINGDFFKLKHSSNPFDLVILDPPYPQNSVAASLVRMQHNHWIHQKTWIAAKTARNTFHTIPQGFNSVWHRDIGLSSLTFLKVI